MKWKGDFIVDFAFLEQYDGKKVAMAWYPRICGFFLLVKSNPDTKMAYVVYDDSNKFIFKGKVIGTVSNRGEVQEETRGYHYDYFNTPSQPKTEVKVKPATTIEMGTPDVGLDKLDDFFAGLSAPIDAFFSHLPQALNSWCSLRAITTGIA